MAVDLCFLGRKNSHTKPQATTVEKAVHSSEGITMSAGAPLPSEARRPTTEVGNSCNEVAFKAKNMHEAYSAFWDLSNSLAPSIPYGVAAPPSPSRLHERLALMACRVGSSSVRNNRLQTGRSSFAIPLVIPHAFHTSISPIQTAYEARRAIHKVAESPAASKTVGKNKGGLTNNKIAVAPKKRLKKMAFIRYGMQLLVRIMPETLYICKKKGYNKSC